MEFRIRIDCDNEAFSDPAWEIARLLRGVADRLGDRICSGTTAGPLRDINGNTCGAWGFGESEAKEG